MRESRQAAERNFPRTSVKSERMPAVSVPVQMSYGNVSAVTYLVCEATHNGRKKSLNPMGPRQTRHPPGRDRHFRQGAAAPELDVKRSVAITAFILLACFAMSAAPPLVAVSGNLVFLESPDVKGKLPKSKLARSMAELVRALKLPLKTLPRVLVLHVSSEAGKAVGVQSCSLRHNSGQIADPYYELWIVGDANAGDYTAAFEQVLERHFELPMTDAERNKVIAQVVRYLDATIDAHGE
jgi:hypothetical protein